MIDTTSNTDTTNTLHECGLTTPAVNWVQEHGSAFLRFCVEEGAFCVRAYNEERAQKEAPGWSLLDEAAYQPLNPPVEAMQLLARAREQFPQARLRQIHRDHHDEFVAVVESPWPDGQKLVFNEILAVEDDNDD